MTDRESIGQRRLCRFLAAEEEVTIDYKFGVYDLLVLPPAFPYGGMVCTAYAVALALLIRVG